MSTTARTYAHALMLATEHIDGPTAAQRMITALMRSLARRGHGRLLPAIAAEYDRLASARRHNREIEVIAATRDDAEAFIEREMSHMRTLLGAPEDARVRMREDTTLIGGTEVRFGDIRIDGSYKRALLELFRSIRHTQRNHETDYA